MRRWNYLLLSMLMLMLMPVPVLAKDAVWSESSERVELAGEIDYSAENDGPASLDSVITLDDGEWQSDGGERH